MLPTDAPLIRIAWAEAANLARVLRSRGLMGAHLTLTAPDYSNVCSVHVPRSMVLVILTQTAAMEKSAGARPAGEK